jgi:hypothetical protein
MAELLPKDRAALAFIYELDEFKSLKKWADAKYVETAKQLLKVDMGQPGAPARVGMLQGQAYAFEFMMLELKKIHKTEMEKEFKKKK